MFAVHLYNWYQENFELWQFFNGCRGDLLHEPWKATKREGVCVSLAVDEVGDPESSEVVVDLGRRSFLVGA